LLFLEEALYLLSDPAYLAEKSLERVLQLSLDIGKALRANRTKGVIDSMGAHMGARVFAFALERMDRAWVELPRCHSGVEKSFRCHLLLHCVGEAG
jgi:hypothetical protein